MISPNRFYRSSSILLWIATAVLINSISFYFLLQSNNKASHAVTASLVFLLLTFLSRAYLTIKWFYLMGEKSKSYFFHYTIYNIGFFHRSAAVSSIGWFIYHFILSDKIKPYYDEALSIILITSLLLVAVLAIDIVRRKKHHIFEFVHRFVGYGSLAILVGYYFLNNIEQGGLYYKNVILDFNFYIILAILVLAIEPWIKIKRIQIESKVIGKNIFSLTINEPPDYGTFSRISLLDGEFHSIANSIYDFDEKNKNVLYVAAVGDSTKKILRLIANLKELHKLEDAPKLWVRHHRGYGFMRHVTVYDKVVIVSTGGGIAPAIPHFVLNNKTEIKFLWITHDPKVEFPGNFLENLEELLKKRKTLMKLINTTELKHLHLDENYFIQQAIDFCKEHKPQAIFFITNPSFAKKVSKELDKHKIRSYMPTFDS